MSLEVPIVAEKEGPLDCRCTLCTNLGLRVLAAVGKGESKFSGKEGGGCT